MRTLHVTDETWIRLSVGDLDPSETATILRHVGACAECAAKGRIVAQGAQDDLLKWLGEEEPEDHLDLETQLSPYVMGTLTASDREIVESHVEDCSPCGARLETVEGQKASHRFGWRALLAVAAMLAVVVAIGALSFRNRPVETPQRIGTATIRPATPEPTAPKTARYDDPRWQELVDKALRDGRLPFPSGKDVLRGRVDSLRGPASNARAASLDPAGILVDDDRPRFSWPLHDHASYVVSVFEDDSPVVRSNVLRINQWRADRALQRGHVYVWQVEVLRNGVTSVLPAPPAPQATFGITSHEDHDALSRARAAYPRDSLLYAVLAARAGLRTEAINALRGMPASDDPAVLRLTHSYAPQ